MLMALPENSTVHYPFHSQNYKIMHPYSLLSAKVNFYLGEIRLTV